MERAGEVVGGYLHRYRLGSHDEAFFSLIVLDHMILSPELMLEPSRYPAPQVLLNAYQEKLRYRH